MSESEMHICVGVCVCVCLRVCVFVRQCTHLFLHEFQAQEAQAFLFVTSTVKTASQYLLQTAAVGEWYFTVSTPAHAVDVAADVYC